MKILVAYDSYFGNTEKVARAVADAVASAGEVAFAKVDQVKPGDLEHLDLLFVGSPTRGFAPSDGTRAFLKQFKPGSLANVRAAVFDTRIPLEDMKPAFLRFMQKLAGYADVKMAASLKSAGALVILPSQGFLVAGMEGPLKEGELERAAAWAKRVVDELSA